MINGQLDAGDIKIYIEGIIPSVVGEMSIGVLADKATWRIDYLATATEAQKAAVQDLVDGAAFVDNALAYAISGPHLSEEDLANIALLQEGLGNVMANLNALHPDLNLTIDDTLSSAMAKMKAADIGWANTNIYAPQLKLYSDEIATIKSGTKYNLQII